ncbi:MAG TPA: HEAT repeat domain-containing protein [Humibacillus sp.]|nr:HEAT repeat domain-containing protein [Humibacillus sp.]
MPLFGPPRIEKLAAKGDIDGLVRALGYTKDRQVASDAAAALVAIGAPAVEPLASVARNPEHHGRWCASDALASISDPRAVDALLLALGDESDVVRKDAAAALGTIGDPRARDALLAALADPSDAVHGAAVSALGAIGGPPAVEPLIAELSGPYSASAAAALGRIGDARAVGPLGRVLFDGEWRSRWVAADVLGDLADPRAVEPLVRALLDAELVERDAHDNLEFARALAGLDPSRSTSLQATLEDQTAFVRTHAATALGRLGDLRAVEPLRTALRDPGAGRAFRAAVTTALQSLGVSETEPGAGPARATREPKPLTVNLGEVERSTLEAIVESDQPMAIAQGPTTDLVTPALARQAMEAKDHESRADDHARDREFTQAVEEYLHAIRTAPYEDEVLWMSLGGVLSELRAYSDALGYLETAYAINPLNDDVIRNLAIAQANSAQAAGA